MKYWLSCLMVPLISLYVKLPGSDGQIICILQAHALALLICLSLKVGFSGRDPKGSHLNRILLVGIEVAMIWWSPSPPFILERMQGLVKKHHLCSYLKSTLTHSTPQLLPGKGWRFVGMSLVQGWRVTLEFNHTASKLVSVKAFLGAKRTCCRTCLLPQTKSSQGKNDNHFIVFIPS